MSAKKRRPAHREAAIRKHERTVERLGRLVSLWMDRLWLGQWQIDVTWEWNGIRNETGQPNFIVHANCVTSWAYLHAHIRFDVPECSVLSAYRLEAVVVHELMHVHVAQMCGEGVDPNHEERVVTQLTNVLMHAYRARVS